MGTRNLVILLILGSAVLLSSCATVAHGRFQQVPVVSDPAGAAVQVDCGRGAHDAGVTPVVVKVRRKADFCTLTLTHDGYRSTTVTLSRRWSGWIWGNLLLGDAFLAGAVVDLADGAFYTRTPRKVNVTLPVAETASR